MRFIKLRPSSVDKDIPVFEFAFGVEELKLLLNITKVAKKRLTEAIELNPVKHRLNNIIREWEKTIREYKNQ